MKESLKNTLIKVKPILNKKNNQINISLPRKKLPVSIKEMIDSNKMPIINVRLESGNR